MNKINRNETTFRSSADRRYWFTRYPNGETSTLRSGEPSYEARQRAAAVGNEIVVLQTVDTTPDPRQDSSFDPSLTYMVA